MNPELTEAIEQLDHSPMGKLLPSLILLGSSMTTTGPEPWLIQSINKLQARLADKEKADLFFLLGTHTVKAINENRVAELFGTNSPSLEIIDQNLAQAIKSLHQSVQDKMMQMETVEIFYDDTWKWLVDSFAEDEEKGNEQTINFMNSLKPLMQKENNTH